MAHLITGYAGTEHIQSKDQGSFNASFFGTGQYVMHAGNQCDASITTNNNVRVLDGDILMYGRHIRIESGTYEDMTIETGTAGKNRNDLIVMTYSKDNGSGIESASLQVVKGTETEGIATDPAFTNGNILEGATFNQMPLYRVCVRGVVLTSIEPLFATIPTYQALAEAYAEQFAEACQTHLNSLNILDTMEEIEANTQSNQLAGALALKEAIAHAGIWLGSHTIASGSTTKVITDASINATSIIDVYYAEESKLIVQDAVASYTQETGKLTISFESDLADSVTIQNVKVVNP